MPYDNLTRLSDDLRRSIPDADKFNFVVIRLMLRTGVNIKEPAPRHIDNPVTIARVLEVLAALGLELDGGPPHE